MLDLKLFLVMLWALNVAVGIGFDAWKEVFYLFDVILNFKSDRFSNETIEVLDLVPLESINFKIN